ncbi:hypothetical protein F4809DRAFT_299234 [Biscogniauxia mediterranea]|nr:hypothetical protein F4809DRAFT_299234 [Biscogniauxia mediterranea]
MRYENIAEHANTAASTHMPACCYHQIRDVHSLNTARHVLQDSLRILKFRPSKVDEICIIRALFKLSLVHEAFHAPWADTSRVVGGKLHTKLTKPPIIPCSEEVLNMLVP